MALTYDETVTAVVSLLRVGINPSADRVRAHLGRGSKSTILKYLSQWRETLDANAAVLLPADLPEALVPAVTTFWEHATTLAAASFDQERQRYEARIAAAVEEADQAREEATSTKTRLETLETELTNTRDRLSQAKNQIEVLTDQLEEHQRELAQRVAEHRQAIDELRRDHEVAIARSEDQRRREVELRDVQVDELRAAVKAADERFDRTEIHWMGEIAKSRDQASALIVKLEEERKKSRERVRLLDAQLQRSAQDRSQLESRAYALEAELEQAKMRAADQAELGAQKLAALQERLEATIDDLRTARADKERLNELLTSSLTSVAATQVGSDSKQRPQGESAQEAGNAKR